MHVPIVPRHEIPYSDGTTAEWMYVRLFCCLLVLFLRPTVADLVDSGRFDIGVVHDDIVEAARQNLVKGGGRFLRFGIDVIDGGRIAIRVFPSRALVASSSSTQTIGQRVEGYIVEANRRECLDADALVPCAVPVCSVRCVVLGLDFATLMILSKRRFWRWRTSARGL